MNMNYFYRNRRYAVILDWLRCVL